jgi:hypothetical protein
MEVLSLLLGNPGKYGRFCPKQVKICLKKTIGGRSLFFSRKG